MNEIEIAGILHVQYRGSAVLHCIILYQNGHSGPKSSEIVSRNFCMFYCLLQCMSCNIQPSFQFANVQTSLKYKLPARIKLRMHAEVQ